MSSLAYIRRITVLVAAAIGALSSTGCATTVHTETAPSVSMAEYQTFALATPRMPSDQSATLHPEITPMFIRQVREHVVGSLTARGFTQVDPDQADLIVLIHGGITRRVDVQEDYGFYISRYGRAYGRDQTVDVTDEGTLVIDLADRETKEIVWRGWRTANVNGAPKIEKLQRTIDAIVAEIAR